MEIVSIIGMIAALALLSFLVMKGVNIFIAAIASSLLVAITGQIGLYDALQTDYMSGFTGFFGSNFLIFKVLPKSRTNSFDPWRQHAVGVFACGDVTVVFIR